MQGNQIAVLTQADHRAHGKSRINRFRRNFVNFP
jgi:hypothetical protein